MLEPDIVYRDGQPGTSAVGCVVPAVEAILAKGQVDPQRVGLVGHSWGGYEASYIPTQTKVFAAAVAGAPLTKLQTPMLVFFGDKDGTVDWHQGVELYNYARRAGKFLVMLVYPGEDHSARQKKNQIDYHRRVLQWFGHFLKGEEAPAWITRGVPVLERERELRKLRATTNGR